MFEFYKEHKFCQSTSSAHLGDGVTSKQRMHLAVGSSAAHLLFSFQMVAVFLRSVYCMVFFFFLNDFASLTVARCVNWDQVPGGDQVGDWGPQSFHKLVGLGPRGGWHLGPLAAVWRYWFFSLPLLSDSSEVGMVWSFFCGQEKKNCRGELCHSPNQTFQAKLGGLEALTGLVSPPDFCGKEVPCKSLAAL